MTEHLPEPELEELQQHDVPIPAVPVNVIGPVTVHQLPARSGPAFAQPLTTDFQRVLSVDLKRARANLIGSAAWQYSRTGAAGSGVPWPIAVPLVIEHGDSVYARVTTETATLSVITEVWAD